MHTRVIRFISQCDLVSVMLLILVGVGLIARHIDSGVTPSSAVGGEPAAIGEIPEVLELLIQESSIVSSQASLSDANCGLDLPDPFWKDDLAGLDPSGKDEPNLVLPDDFACEAAAPRDSVENPEGCADSAPVDVDDFPVVSPPDSDHEKMQKLRIDRHSDSNDNIQRRSKPDVNSTGDTGRTTQATEQQPIKLDTKVDRVETVLKEAIIEPHKVHSQTEGLRITGLEAVSAAKNLGLKNGDIILAINGQPLNSNRQAYKIFKKAKKKPIMKVDLLRDGETKALVFVFH